LNENLHFEKGSIYKGYKSGNKEKVQKKEQLEADSSGVRRGKPRRRDKGGSVKDGVDQ
jgi:hypothetical protein